MDVQYLSGGTIQSRAATPGSPVSRQPIAAGKPTIDPMEMLSQRHRQELQARNQQGRQEWYSIWRMQPVVGFEKTQKLAAESYAKVQQDLLALQQNFEMQRNQFAQIDALYSKQPEAARRAKLRSIYGAEEANRMVPKKVDPGARLSTLLNRAAQLDRYEKDTYRVRPQAKKRRIGRAIATYAAGGLPGFLAGAAYGRLRPKQEQGREIDVWDWTAGEDGMGGWRPATPSEQRARDRLQAEKRSITEEIGAINNRTEGGAQANIAKVARESQRMLGGTFAQKVQFSDKKLEPRPARKKAPTTAGGGQMRKYSPSTGKNYVSSDGGQTWFVE